MIIVLYDVSSMFVRRRCHRRKRQIYKETEKKVGPKPRPASLHQAVRVVHRQGWSDMDGAASDAAAGGGDVLP